MSEAADEYDYIIAGGGSAGCVLAARLSENPDTRVLLVESGPDLPLEAVPSAISSSYPGRAHFNRDWVWPGLKATIGVGAGNERSLPQGYEQARILGGGSSINGIVANRGAVTDYDEWVGKGATGWAWDDVLPFFRKLERDLDFDGPLHGKDGPVSIQRVKRTQWSGFIQAIEQACVASGLPAVDDQNGPWSIGVMPTATNADEHGRRASAALVYLNAAVRARHNLSIMTRTIAKRIHFSGQTVSGLSVVRQGTTATLRARRVIVSSGALGTPTLLMRSGIGPGAHLAERGIACVADLPGVGENLMEHPAIGVSGFLPPAARMAEAERFQLQAAIRWSSGLKGTPYGDMYVSVSARAAWHAVGERMGTMFSWVNKSYSSGRLKLALSPDDNPDIDFRMLSDPRDLQRLMASFRFSVEILRGAAQRGAVLEIFPTSYSGRIKKLIRPTLRNALLMKATGPLMDLNAGLRRKIIALATEGVEPLDKLMTDDEALATHLKRGVCGVWHPCGSARMGRADDPMAVTDPSGQVRGVEGLYVCDASLMPTMLSANLNIPVLMIAEKVAAGLAHR